MSACASISSLLSSNMPPPTRATLFPYTTLFRSRWRLGLDQMRLAADGARRLLRRRVCRRRRRPCPRQIRPIGERQRSEEHTSELQSRLHLVCRLLLEKKKTTTAPPSSCVRLCPS